MEEGDTGSLCLTEAARAPELSANLRLEVARSKYNESVARYPNRVMMLCDRATVLARSDRSPAMRRVG